MTAEWRAVFTDPPFRSGLSEGGWFQPGDSYGPIRRSRPEAEADRPPRSEESRSWRSGLQRREVTEWTDLRKPAEWAQIEGVEILDPDGWRAPDVQDFEKPITQAEFRERLAHCTIRFIR